MTISYKQEPPYAGAMRLVAPGSDEFPGEKLAAGLENLLSAAMDGGSPPVSASCRGSSPLAGRYEQIAPDVAKAVFESGDPKVSEGWRKWRETLGRVEHARFYALPDNIVRYDIRARNAGRLEHRIGTWRVSYDGTSITELRPLEEVVTSSSQPWFRDVTAHVFERDESFREQLSRGVPYWRGRLDPACGIDLYGANGISVADIDGDGRDEIYVCQPGGLPNRLYKLDADGRAREISKQAGLDFLDDTAAALFVDLRNSGQQDLVLVRSSRPLLFLNDGHGRFTELRGRVPLRDAASGFFYQRGRGRYRPGRPRRSVLLLLRLLPERRAIPLPDAVP